VPWITNRCHFLVADYPYPNFRRVNLIMIIELDITLFHVVCTFTVRWRQYFVDITITIAKLLNILTSNLQVLE